MKKGIIYILLLFHVFFTGNIWVVLNNHIANAEIGDIGHWKDSVWGQIPGTTFAGFNFNQEIRNDGIYTKPSNDTIQLNEAWDYLIIATTHDEDTSNGRYNSQLKVEQTAGTWELFTSHYSAYSRDNSENESWTRAISVIIGASANSQVQVQKRRDTDAPLWWSVVNNSDVQVIRLDQTNYGIYGIWGTGNSYGWVTPNVVDIDSIVSESDITAIRGNTTTDEITLMGDNKKYLIAWSTSFTVWGVRTQRSGHLAYNNIPSDSTKWYCYSRNAANEYCGLGSMDVVETTSTDISVKAEVFRGPWVAVDDWWGDSDGSAITDGNGQMIVLEMPDYLEVFRSEDSVGLQDITLPQTLNIARDVNIADSLSFTKNSDTLVNVINPADIFSWANIWTARENITSGQRQTSFGSVTIDGVEQTLWQHWGYSRWNQSTTDTFALGLQPAGIFNITWPGSTLWINTDPLAGWENGWNDKTKPGTVGFFALNFDTLVAPSLSQSSYRWFENTDSTDIGPVLSAQDTSATLSTNWEAFRLRSLMSVTQNQLRQNEKDFKLQFAEKVWTCDISFSGESYADVTTSTAIAFNDNSIPIDNIGLTANVVDPVNIGITAVNQSYQELNNFTTSVSAIPRDQDGKWDFSLIDNTAPDDTNYCFRIVESDGTLLDNYTVIPEITTATAILSCSVNDVNIEFTTDNWWYETYWSLTPTGDTCWAWSEIANGWNATQVGCTGWGEQDATTGNGYANNITVNEWPYTLIVWTQYDLHVVDDFADGIFPNDPDVQVQQNWAATDTFIVEDAGWVFSFTVQEPLGCVDIVSPNVTVDQASSQADPTAIDSATFTVVFDEPINIATFTVADITLSGTTGSVTSGPTEVTPNNGTSFEFSVTGITSWDVVTASVWAWIIEDLAWNTNIASTSTDNQVMYISVNNSPTDIILSNDTIDENVPAATAVWTLSSTDADLWDTHTYALVSWTWDTDNSTFTISGNTLTINASPDFETQSSYFVRIETDDGNGWTFEKIFTISINDLDEIPPTISSTNFASGALLPGWNHDIIINYSDNGSGIDASTANISLYKWDEISAYGPDFSATGIIENSVSSSEVHYSTNNLSFGKYQYTFTVYDFAGNFSSETLEFYIDEPEFIISTPEIDLWDLSSLTNTFSDVVTVTVKTVWAPFDVTFTNTTSLTSIPNFLTPWNGSTGFWFEQSPFSWSIGPINTDQLIASETILINTNWDKNTYNYDIQLWALVEALQTAWEYIWDLKFDIDLEY